MAGARRPIEGHRKLLAEPEPLWGASPKNDKDVSLVLHAHGLPTVRICLLIASAVLLSTSADPSLASSSSSHGAVSSIAAKRGTTGRRSYARGTKCLTAARRGKHRKVRKSCAVKRSKATVTKPSVSRKQSGSEPSFL